VSEAVVAHVPHKPLDLLGVLELPVGDLEPAQPLGLVRTGPEGAVAPPETAALVARLPIGERHINARLELIRQGQRLPGGERAGQFGRRTHRASVESVRIGLIASWSMKASGFVAVMRASVAGRVSISRPELDHVSVVSTLPCRVEHRERRDRITRVHGRWAALPQRALERHVEARPGAALARNDFAVVAANEPPPGGLRLDAPGVRLVRANAGAERLLLPVDPSTT